MTLSGFVKTANVTSALELEKVRLLSFFYYKTASKVEFTLNDITEWFLALHFAAPNTYRLRNNISESRSFIQGSTYGTYKLHAADIEELQESFPGVRSDSEEVISDDTILPTTLFESTRGFIESLSRQINAAYEFNIFDGCAVLMRRLIEVLLILSYENRNIETAIKDKNDNYLMLERIIDNAKNNKTLNLSRNSKNALDEFRILGNFAAHKIYYTTRRTDIRNALKEFRALVEELLYKSGIRI